MKAASTLKDFFSESFSNFPERPAISCFNHTLSYRQLDELSTNLASYLHYDLQLNPGDKIAIQLPNLLQYPVVILAAIKAGVVIVNTNPLYTKKELAHQLIDSKVKAIILLSSFVGKLNSIIHKTKIEHIIVTYAGDLLPPTSRFFLNTFIKIKEISFSSETSSLVTFPRINFLSTLSTVKHKKLPTIPITPDSLALLQYTGGTTGISKGAMLSHSNLLSNVKQIRWALQGSLKEGEEIIIAPLPIYHIFCFMVCILFGMGIGAHLILIPDPRKTNRLITTLKGIPFTFFIGLNTLFNNLCRHKDFSKLNFHHLKVTVSGGMTLIKDTALTWQGITGSKIIEGYGLTEASPVVSLNPFDAPQLGTVGKLLENTESRFIDVKGNDVALGTPGELLIRGPQVMLGYWLDPSATHEAIDQEGWLHTGDIAVINDEGYLSIVDRIKDMIVVSGFNVYPNELEKEISKHPDIIECAAIGIADPDTGEAVKLFVVSSDIHLSADDIKAFAHRTLCSYKIPKHIEFLNELPKSNIGKVLRRKLLGK